MKIEKKTALVKLILHQKNKQDLISLLEKFKLDDSERLDQFGEVLYEIVKHNRKIVKLVNLKEKRWTANSTTDLEGFAEVFKRSPYFSKDRNTNWIVELVAKIKKTVNKYEKPRSSGNYSGSAE